MECHQWMNRWPNIVMEQLTLDIIIYFSYLFSSLTLLLKPHNTDDAHELPSEHFCAFTCKRPKKYMIQNWQVVENWFNHHQARKTGTYVSIINRWYRWNWKIVKYTLLNTIKSLPQGNWQIRARYRSIEDTDTSRQSTDVTANCSTDRSV